MSQHTTEMSTASASVSEKPSFPKKLTGREFYKSIGSPKFVVAPMVERSEFAWRMLTRSFMEKNESQRLLAYSPMFHARLYKGTEGFRAQHFQPIRQRSANNDNDNDNELAEPFLDGNPAIDRPLFVQFCANDPDDFLEAARLVAPYCDAVDLNLGCPQGIARRGHYGAFLQEDWDLIYKLINKLHTELPIPVTAKFRIQETKEKTLDYAKMILSAGASIITVHGRRREQKGHNTGVADWSYIRYLRENLPSDTVIFANGNILNHRDIEHCLEATGADGVMSAEGNLSDPTIFAKIPAIGNEGREYWRGQGGQEGYRMDAVFRRYMDIIYKYVLAVPAPERQPLFLPSASVADAVAQIDTTDEKTNTTQHNGEVNGKRKAECNGDGKEAVKSRKRQRRSNEKKVTEPNLTPMQGHLFQLLRPLVSKHTNIRDALAKTRAGNMEQFEQILSMVESVVKEGILEYERDPSQFQKQDGNADKLEGSKATRAQYARPWWICQPYIRPLPEEALAIGAMKISKKDQRKAAEAAADTADETIEPTSAFSST